MFRCIVIADSINPCGNRCVTLEVSYPRFIHAEIMTHRDRARNAGSSRAIPWPTMLANITSDPVIPIYWGKNQKGMQTGEEVTDDMKQQAIDIWLKARNNAISSAQELHDLGIHKSLCNRLVEPWMFITVVMTATSWNNFFALRVHKDAEIHFQKIAGMMKTALYNSEPEKLKFGEYHLPYIEEDDWDNISLITREEVENLKNKNAIPILSNLIHNHNHLQILKYASAGRCARVSYIQHGSKVKSIPIDFELCYGLIGQEPLHSSPLEHPCMALATPERIGPFTGWFQFRKEHTNEAVRE